MYRPFFSFVAAVCVLHASHVAAQTLISTPTTYDGVHAGLTGTLSVNGGATPTLFLQNGATLTAGLTSLTIGNTQSGALNISGGSTLTNSGRSYIGLESMASGTATISGANTQWVITNELDVGVSGTGTLNIQNGGKVTSDDSYLGFLENAHGTAMISGANSQWTLNNLDVGYFGTGTLNIQDGGNVTNISSNIGRGLGSGIINVNGENSRLTTYWLTLGEAGSGTLNIQNGGKVTGGFGYLGEEASSQWRSYGEATVSGENSQWSLTNVLVVGGSGTGKLVIQDGATVSSMSGYIAKDFNLYGGSTGTVTVNGPNSRWTVSSGLYVGEYGAGTLNVENDGVVTVGGGLTVGNNASQGRMNVSDGGRVTSDYGWISYNLNSSGTATISGTGSQWTLTSGLTVGFGYNSHATLNVLDGGQVTSPYANVGYFPNSTGTVTVSGAGSGMTADLSVGVLGTGTFNIQSGGTAMSSVGYIGSNAGGIGTATIGGVDSLWTVNTDFYIGGDEFDAGGTGSLTITGGGRVDVAGLTKLWAGHGSITVGPGGTLATGRLEGDMTNNGSVVIGGTNSASTYADAMSGIGALHKIGTGVLILSGNNSYLGGTFVDAGILEFGDSTPTGPIQVADGGTIRATSGSLYINGLIENNGTVEGTVSLEDGAYGKGSGMFEHLELNDGATFSPGNSPGTANDAATTWNGGTYAWEINALSGFGGSAGQDPGWDLWHTGILGIGGPFLISINSLTSGNVAGALANWNPNIDQDWLIATSTNNAFASLSNLSLTTSAFTAFNSLGGGIFSLLSGGGGTELHLHYTAVPEPSSIALGTLLALGLGWRQRRKARAKSTVDVASIR